MCSISGSVLLETSYGNLLIGLYGHDCPQTARNFIRLCSMKFYNGATVKSIVRNAFFEVRGREELIPADGSSADQLLYQFSGNDDTISAHGSNNDNKMPKGVPLETAHQTQGPLLPPDFQKRRQQPVLIGKRGQVIMVSPNASTTHSSFIITTTDRRLDHLDRNHTLVGEIILSSGQPAAATTSAFDFFAQMEQRKTTSFNSPLELLRRVDALALKNGMQIFGQPIRAVHIRHAHVIDDPFSTSCSPSSGSANSAAAAAAVGDRAFSMFDLLEKKAREAGTVNPLKRLPAEFKRSHSPVLNVEQNGNLDGLSSNDDDDDDDGNNVVKEPPSLTAAKKELALLQARVKQRRDTETRNIMMQLIGERPVSAGGESTNTNNNANPPDNVLFVCKLNPFTEDDDLAQCFEQFGKVVSCEIIRDKKTGASLRYAFIEFETAEQCSAAFCKMDKVKIDDSRIHVDFSQSMGPAYWTAQKEKQQRAARQRRTDF